LNLHITPVDFYSPIPNVSGLDSGVFDKVFDDTGLDWNMAEQLNCLNNIFSKYSHEYAPLPNPGLTLVDSFILYAMVRERRPEVMIEIGSGDSTRISLQAIEMNQKEGAPCRFYAVEPYPKKFLKEMHASDMNFKLIETKVEDLDLEFLRTADLLFIDSTHVAKIGSDVNYEILEIVPKLKKGAFVHWHDIMIPTNYWKDWVQTGTMFWNESYMLHAFMLFNEAFKIVWASRYMQLHHADEMKKQLSYFAPEKHRCTSFWVRKIQ
jgi:hypothetical protein